MSVTILFQQMVVIFLLVLSGFTLYRLGLVGDNASREISALVVNVCCPALILMSIYENETEIQMETLLLTALIGVILYAVLVAFGVWMPRLLGVQSKHDKTCYNLMTIFGNIGFMGIPVASAVIGSEGVIYLVVCNIIFNVLIYSYGVYLVARSSDNEEMKFRPGKLVNIGTIASVIAIVLCFFDPPLPTLLTDTISYAGRSTTFLSMVVIGINLAQISFKEIISETRLYIFVVIRQIIFPIAAGLVLKMFIRNEVLLATLVLILALPAANMPLMMMEESGQDGRILSLGIIITTVLAVVTIPLVVMFV